LPIVGKTSSPIYQYNMANLNENRIDQSVSPSQIAAIRAAIVEINTQLDFLVTLTDEERLSKKGIDVANKVFVDDTLNELINNPSVFPSYVNVSRLENDIQLIDQLDSLRSSLNGLEIRIEDTRRQAAHEAITQAMAAYNGVQMAAKVGVLGAQVSYDRLKRRFKATKHGRPSSVINLD
jgi:hypothetical protein